MILLLAGIGAVFVAALVVAMRFRRVVVAPGHALLVNRLGRWSIRRHRAYILPRIHVAESVNLAERELEIPRGRHEPIRCKDGVIAKVRMAMTMKVGEGLHDALKAAQSFGTEQLNSDAYLVDYFGPKLLWAVQVVAVRLPNADFMRQLDDVSRQVSEVIGRDLDGLELLAVRLREDRPGEAVSVGVFR